MIACVCTKKDTCKFQLLTITGGRYPTITARLHGGEEVMMYADANGPVALISAAKLALIEMVTA